MLTDDEPTLALIERANHGDAAACEQLLGVHRDRLRKMVSLRMDRRLAARVDASDIVQEALAEASRCLADYLQCRPLPFYPWLRRLAWERLVAINRQHVQASKRSVAREERYGAAGSDSSAIALVDRLAAQHSSPSEQMTNAELRKRVQGALATLEPQDREILVLRYLEQLSTHEAAAVLGLTDSGVKSRLMRALIRMREMLDG